MRFYNVFSSISRSTINNYILYEWIGLAQNRLHGAFNIPDIIIDDGNHTEFRLHKKSAELINEGVI
jgi:hypothetical protein